MVYESAHQTTWYSVVFCFIIFLLSSLLTGVGAKADPADDFKNLLFDETEHFVLNEVAFDEDAMFLQAEYIFTPLDLNVKIYLEYGSTKNIAEMTGSYNETLKIAHAFNRRQLSEVLKDNDNLKVNQKIDELFDHRAYFQWQANHSTLLENYPFFEFLPDESGPFELSSFEERNPMEIRVSYTSDESEANLSLNLQFGELARQEYGLLKCHLYDQEEINAGDHSFYGGQGRGGFVHSAQSYIDGVLVAITHRYRTNRVTSSDAEDAVERIEEYAEALNYKSIIAYDYPPVTEPGFGLEYVDLTDEVFTNFFPEQIDDLHLQGIDRYDDQMHLRADYLYEPLDHNVSMHLAYGNYSERLQNNYANRYGFFQLSFEWQCLNEEIPQEQFRNLNQKLREDVFDRGMLTRWELENMEVERLNPMVRLMPVETENYNLYRLHGNPDNLRIGAEYHHHSDPGSMRLSMVYGDEAVEQYNRFQLIMFEEEEYVSLQSDDITFSVLEDRNEFISFGFVDNRLIQLNAREVELEELIVMKQKVSTFLDEFPLDQLTTWQAPDDYEMDFEGTLSDGTTLCLDPYCFDEYLPECERAAFGGEVSWNLGVLYTIEEAVDDQYCRISMHYTDNPNSDVVELPMYFNMNRNDSFKESGMDIVETCMEGNLDAHNCNGPLLEYLIED